MKPMIKEREAIDKLYRTKRLDWKLFALEIEMIKLMVNANYLVKRAQITINDIDSHIYGVCEGIE